MNGEGDPLGIVREDYIWPYEQMIYRRPGMNPRKWEEKNSLGLEIKMDHLILSWWPDLSESTKKKKKEKKKRTCRRADFAIPVDHRVKLKENKKRGKYLNLAREMKKLWNMEVTVIPIVIRALVNVTIELVHGLWDLEIRGQVETIQKTPSLRLARILRRVFRIWGDLMAISLLGKTIC